MQLLDLQQTADFLETAVIEQSFDLGWAIVHTGRNEAGARFTLMNDAHGSSALSEAP